MRLYVWICSTSLVAALGWGVSPFLENVVVKKTDFQTAFVLKGILYGIFGLVLFLMNIKHFLKIKDHYEVVKEKKVPLVLFSIVSVVFAYLIGNIAYLFALSVNNDATMLVPLIAYVMPIIIMTIISYFVTKDNINMRMMIGIAITIFGIVFTLLNKDK